MPPGRRISRLRLDQRFGLIIALFLVLIGLIVGYNARATARQRDTALIINVAARQRGLAERYIKDVLLKADGYASDPETDATTLRETAAALLAGGNVLAVQGADATVHISPITDDWKVVAKLRQERSLIDKLISTGNGVLLFGRSSADFDQQLLQLRIIGAQVSHCRLSARAGLTPALSRLHLPADRPRRARQSLQRLPWAARGHGGLKHDP